MGQITGLGESEFQTRRDCCSYRLEAVILNQAVRVASGF